MRSRILNSIILFIFIFTLFTFSPKSIHASSETAIKAINVIGQGVGTLLRGIIQGKVKNLKSAGKMLFWGSVSGYGFYEAKRMIGQGHVTEGVILANIAASVTENTARGDNPFSYLGYTIGPARIQIATPLAGKNKTLFNIQISPRDIIGLVNVLKWSESVSFRNGMIAFEAIESYRGTARGWALGMYPTVVTGVPEHVFYHESIHVVQYIQTMALSPQPLNCLLDKGIEEKKLFNISLMNFNYASLLTKISLNEEDPRLINWHEVEAYALAQE